MSFYEAAKYTLAVFSGIAFTGITVLTYIGYRQEKQIKDAEKRAKVSKLEKTVDKK